MLGELLRAVSITELEETKRRYQICRGLLAPPCWDWACPSPSALCPVEKDSPMMDSAPEPVHIVSSARIHGGQSKHGEFDAIDHSAFMVTDEHERKLKSYVAHPYYEKGAPYRQVNCLD